MTEGICLTFSMQMTFNKRLILSLLVGSCFGFFIPVNAQQKTAIKLVRADKMSGRQSGSEELNILTGNVIFEHDTIRLYCDSAVLRNRSNSLDAYRNVHLRVNDTLNLYSEKLFYDGNARVATFSENVRLVDDDATLYTNQLIYLRNSGMAWYKTGGRIVSDTNELVSREGYYFTTTKILHFKKDVVLTSPHYRLESDTLVYHTTTEIAYIHGPTTLKSPNSFMYTEKGWYDTRTGTTSFTKKSYIRETERYISGDTLIYDKPNETGLIIGNVYLHDTVQSVIFKGDLSRYFKNKGFAYVTKKPLATYVDNSDTLWLHADTLRVNFDTTGKTTSFSAYYTCKFFRHDLQGKCDSLVYDFVDSTITLFRKPVVWHKQHQITSEFLKGFTSGNGLDSLWIMGNAFIISRDPYNPDYFNQIKGKNMVAYFSENELYLVTVNGNSETIYFVREDDGNLIGINRAFSSFMKIYVNDGQITNIIYFESPDATLFPESELQLPELRLKDFRWLESERPLKWEDIFVRQARQMSYNSP